MDAKYLSAQSLSYGQQQGELEVLLTGGILEIPLGFQPLGISSRPADSSTDMIAIAAYFEPAVCLARVQTKGDTLTLSFKVSWIRAVRNGCEDVRMFPRILEPAGANRAETVNFAADGSLWVSRNAERVFFVMEPPKEQGGLWNLVEKISLPENGVMSMVHSALLVPDTLHTIESNAALDQWKMFQYSLDGRKVLEPKLVAGLPPWTYGIAFKGKREGTYAVTDFRSERPHGVYRGGYIAVPGVAGNGICFLSDGSALVTRYGQGHPGCFNGVPGALLYVPASLF